MFRSIQWRITVPFIILVVVSLSATGFYLTDHFRSTQINDLRGHLLEEANIIAETSSPLLAEGADVAELVQNLGERIEARVTIIAVDGTVLGDSEEDPALMDNHRNRHEIQDALDTGYGESQRYSLTLQQEMMYVAVPVVQSGTVLGVARVALPLAAVNESANRVTVTVSIVMAITALLVILVAWYVARRTTRPIKEVTMAAQSIASGNLTQQITVTSDDEASRLARAFNQMSANLEQLVATISGDRARLASILGNIADGVIMLDREGRIVLANRTAGLFYGFREDDVVGRSLIEAVRDHEVRELADKCLRGGERQSMQLDSEPARRFLQVIALPVAGEELAGVLLLMQDLTELKGLQTMRRELIGNISHEFRTPLAGIKAMTETLRDGALEDTAAASDFLNRIEGEVDRMTQMVAELTELSRIETGKADLRLENVELDKLTEEVAAQLQPQAGRKQQKLSAVTDAAVPPVNADRERIRQVIINLVHNAVKFSPEGAEITVITGLDNGLATVAVRDTGSGIAAADLPHIFERFYKADKARSGRGSGMGLAIAKHTVEAHGGSIRVSSEPGAGTTVSFTLPAAAG